MSALSAKASFSSLGLFEHLLGAGDGVRSWKGYTEEEKSVLILKKVTFYPNLGSAV